MKQFYYIAIFIIIILYLNSCTENPYFEDKIDVQKNRIIKGKVNLGYGAIPNNVYIWLEGLNLSDWTDNDGRFSIELPPAESQPGNGLNGIYALFFYLANYKYEKFDLLVLDGSFRYDTDIIDSNGHFKETVTLTKILDIQTVVLPDNIENTSKDTLNFDVRLECMIDSVYVQTHFNIWNTPSSLVFHKEDSAIEDAILIQGNPGIFKTIKLKGMETWPSAFVFPSNFFSQGIFEVNPYLRIVQEGLPDELLLSIDKNIFEVDFHYLYWPIKTKAGLLTVNNIEEQTYGITLK